jgi:hypothetical protein
MQSTPHIDIVFDGPPGPECGRFVEVENAMQASICFGEWVHRDDGYWVLRIKPHDCSLLGVTKPSDPPGFEAGFADNH